MRLQYSIILPTCNRVSLVSSFLKSIEQQTMLPSEVVVIDQSDDEETKDLFEQWSPQKGSIKKKYVHSKIKSLILARHAGLDACGQTGLVAFLDDDITLDPLFCEEIVKIFTKDKEGKFAGGMGTVDGWEYRKKPFQTFFFDAS